VLSEEKQSFPRERCGPLILNAGGKAYYRSAYEPEQLRELSKRIETDLSAAERVALVGDQWALVRAGEQTLAGFLDLVAALRGERERAVVEEVLERLGTVRRSLVDDAQRPGFDAWVRGLLGPAAAEIGWSGEASDTDDRRSLRARLLGALAAAGDAEALARAKAVVAAYAAQPASVDSTLAEAAFGAVARTADAALYDDWLRRVDRAATPEEHDRYLFALALVRDPALVARSIALWSSPTMREQDLAPFVSAMIFNPASRDAAWAALQASWSGMRQKVISFGGSGAVEALGSYCDALARDRIASFFAGHPTPEAERTVKRSLESIDDCAALKAAQAASLASWLAAR
jgi:aminopeptidase N/puromycin-sensitive aminopeptidase